MTTEVTDVKPVVVSPATDTKTIPVNLKMGDTTATYLLRLAGVVPGIAVDVFVDGVPVCRGWKCDVDSPAGVTVKSVCMAPISEFKSIVTYETVSVQDTVVDTFGAHVAKALTFSERDILEPRPVWCKSDKTFHTVLRDFLCISMGSARNVVFGYGEPTTVTLTCQKWTTLTAVWVTAGTAYLKIMPAVTFRLAADG
jgi:hypothetical protein